jgi:hypothetical protein
MSPLRLPLRTLCLPSARNEPTFQLQGMSPPGSDTHQRCHAHPGRAGADASSPSCPQSVPGLLFSYQGARHEAPMLPVGRVVTSREDFSSPAVTRLACKKLSTPWAGIASLELIVAPRGVLPIVCRIGRGLPDASTLTTPPGARQLIRMTHRNVCAILHHQHIRRSLIHKSSHPLRRNGSQRFPQAKTVIFHR